MLYMGGMGIILKVMYMYMGMCTMLKDENVSGINYKKHAFGSDVDRY